MNRETEKTAKPRRITPAEHRRRLRNHLHHLVDLAVERLDLDLCYVDAHALRTHDRRLGLRGSTSSGARAVERYIALDRLWSERREQLPEQLTGALKVAMALAHFVAATAPPPDDSGLT